MQHSYSLILSGQPIYYNESSSSLFNLGKSEVDEHLAHIWWDEKYSGKCNKLHFSQRFGDTGVIENFNEAMQIDLLKKEEHLTFDLTFVKKLNLDTFSGMSIEYNRLMSPIILYGVMSQTYSVKQACRMVKKSGDGIIIKSRPDVILTKEIKPIVDSLDLSPNKIYFQSSMDGGHLYAGEFPGRPCDWFYLGHKSALSDFCDGWFDLIPEFYSDGIIHTNELVKKVCIEKNLSYELVDFGALIYKQTNNFYKEYLVNSDFYIDDFDWENLEPKNPNLWPYWIDYIGKDNFLHFKNI